jgi:membrane peptidoglycan carboxypeptidase
MSIPTISRKSALLKGESLWYGWGVMRLSRRVRQFFRANGGPLAVLGTAFILFFLGGGVIWASTLKLPDFRAFEERKRAQSTKIFDRTGEVLLYDVYRDVKRTLVPIDQISIHAQNATIAIEDSDFYNHKGVVPTAILRAFVANIKSGELAQGGSTITQQVIKLTLLTKDKRLTRKIKEAILALKLEQTLTKEEILELYFNESPYGGNLYGIEEAAQVFFKKPASEVTLTEAAYLAAIPNAPTYYSPYGKNLDKLENRKNLVLRRMKENGFITDEEFTTSIAEKIAFQPNTTRSIKAPHFVFYVIDQLKEKFGEDAVLNDGFRVITTLDWKLQEKAEEIVAQRAPEIDKNFNAGNMGVVGVDPKT